MSTINGGSGNDFLQGTNNDDEINAGDGDDRIEGRGGADTIYGGDGDDLLLGYDGSNTAAGSTAVGSDDASEDTLYGGAGADTLAGGDWGDYLYGGSGTDTLYGGTGYDTLDGGSGADTIYAGDGQDTIIVTTVDDGEVIFGGEGGVDNDTLDLSALGPGVTVNFTSAEDGTFTDGTNTVTFSGIENVVTSGTVNPYFLTDLSDGSDDGGVVGTSGDDLIYGGTTNSETDGGAVIDDAISGRDGDDTIFGGEGSDGIGGDAGNDTIFGGDGVDFIGGGAGDDTVYGGAGDDSFGGDDGGDTLYGGAGNDGIGGGDGDDTIFGGAGNDGAGGNAGNDTLYGGDGDDRLTGNEGNDEVHGDAGNDSLSGNAGTNTVYGGTGDDTIVLDGGTDRVYGGDDADLFRFDSFSTATVSGGEGGNDNDTIDLSALGDGVTVTYTGFEQGTISDGTDTTTFYSIENFILTGQDDTVDGSGVAGAMSIDAGDGDDSIATGSWDDTVFGGAGNDRIDAGEGSDSVSGGTGDDTIVVSGTFTGTDSIDGGDGADTLVLSPDDGRDFDVNIGAGTVLDGQPGDQTFTNIENVTTGAGDDSILGDANDNVIDGGAGSDQIYGGDGGDDLFGGDGADTVTGGSGNDTVSGGAGDDSLSGGNGRDTIFGGDGSDTISAGEGPDEAFGGAGDDMFNIGFGDNTYFGGDDADAFYIGFGNDTIFGGEGGDDNDKLSGFFADDALTVTFTGDEQGIYNDDDGDSGAFAEVEMFELTDENDSVDATASSAAVTVLGRGGQDSILGGSGDDDLQGGSGADTLSGDAGDDRLTGGAGDDTFVLSSGGGSDTITDFDAGDGDSDGFTNDQLDTSALSDVGNALTNQDGIVTADEVTVTGGGGSDQVLTFPNGESVAVPDGTVDTSSSGAQFSSLVAMGVPPCFAPGTRILTPGGEVAAERLCVGDLVVTADRGPQPVRWIGRREVDFTDPDNERAERDKPVLISAGALGGGLPRRDLVVSPLHRMLLSGPLVEVSFGTPEVLALSKALMGLKGVRRMRGKRRITYIALLLQRHEILFAEGAATESFRPGHVAMAGLPMLEREKIFRIYPDLRAQPVLGLGPCARPVLPRPETESFVEDMRGLTVLPTRRMPQAALLAASQT